MKRVLHVTIGLLLMSACVVRAQFTAYNDHFSGPLTHGNATAWNVYGTPATSGPLKDIASGANLPVIITITNMATGGGTTAGAPNAGSPAYNVFNGFVDFGNGTVNHAIQTTAAQAVGRVFTGLDPNKRYRYTCTAVRGDAGYVNRWILISLLDAPSFTRAHTGGCITNGTPGVTMGMNQAALNSGANLVGDLVIWENIQPSNDGTFAVHCTQYTGVVPGGASDGPYGYSIAAEKLEEFIFAESPAGITNQPQNQTVAELAPAIFSLSVTGSPRPVLQWYRGVNPIPDATNLTYTLASALLSDHGATFFVTASNFASNVSYVVTSTTATLSVTPDTVRPILFGAVSSGGGVVQVTFSEPLTSATATNLANYVITNSSGVLQITNATLAVDRTNVTLYTQTQVIGAEYTLTVNGIRDVSAAGNLVVANSQVTFTAIDYASANIGSPTLPGSLTILSSSDFNVTAAGSAIGGTADQFTMSYQQKAGDFDVKVRVASLGFTDPWAQASLMARESLESNSVFAASVATPLVVGSLFQSRAATGVATVNSGNFPANYPNMWLRLQRVGNVFTGFAGMDGQNWVQLGTVTLNIGSVYLGFGVTSHNVAQTTTAQFREYNTTGAAQVIPFSSLSFSTEPLSAAARSTPIVISEIMYNPAASNAILEYIELYNSNPYFEDISGYRLSGDVNYTFPPNTIVGGGSFLVVAKFPPAMQTAYGLTGVLGPFENTNSLPSKGTIRLRNDYGAIMLTVEYSNDNPWPKGADATGHSLALTRASYGQNVPKSWDASDRVGGSPGRQEPLQSKSGLRAVVINEILAHTDLPQQDYIELYNYSTNAVDISGCYLTDAPSTNKFQIPPSTVLQPRGYVSFNETQLGFSLNHRGETIYLRSPDGLRMLDAVQYEPQENGVAFGRYPDGSPEFYRLQSLTSGTTNSLPRVDDVVINEIMYAPISEEDDDEYVELYNKGTSAVNISGWRFTSGIDFKFPPNTILASNGYVVVAKNKAHLLPRYPDLNSANTFGNYDGTLSRDGERLALGKPDFDVTTNIVGQLVTNTLYVVVDEVTYGTGGRWGKWANQGGSSMELIDPRSNHRLAYNWGDSDETAKAPWTRFDFTGVLDSPPSGNSGSGTQGGTPIDRIEVYSLGEGEYLLDDIEVRYPNGGANLVSNGNFESGALAPWTPQGNHIRSTIENSGNNSARSMHVRAGGNGDTGANRIRNALSPALTAGQILSITGYVRWLRGWPETTLRIKGGYLEAYARMNLPSNLGSPGAPNSRALTNNAPAIHSVAHTPVLPQAGDSVVVRAGVQDPDGVASVTLFYRVDSASPPAYTSLAMNDSGINGDTVARDGIYSGLIPVQNVGTMITFYVESTDTRAALSRFPANAITVETDGQRHECLVRWGDPIPVSAFATYRLWISRANVSSYMNRPALSNQDIDSTMVVGNNRAIYNMFSHYSNSPYHQTQNFSPESGGQHFDIHLPLDDKYLGTENFNKVHAPGNASFEDNNWIREQTAYWVARKMQLPYLHRRFVAMYVNGTRKAGGNAGPTALMEDTQRPGGELIEEFFPDESEGQLHKNQPWFEFDDVTVTAGNVAAAFDNKSWCTLMPILSTNAHKITRYRQNWLSRSTDVTANDYTNVIALINAASLPTSHPAYWQNLSGLIDIDQWARTFAVQHAVGNWDSFGGVNAQNSYTYKPKNGKWKVMIWDLNIVLNHSGAGQAGPGTTSNTPGGNLFDVQSGQDPNMAAMEAYPPFRRAWWRAYKELTVGPNAPMLAANCDPLIDAKNNAFRASGLTPGAFASNPNSVKLFLAVAQPSIASQVAAVDFAGGFSLATANVTASSSNLVTISGSASFDVTEIDINGLPWNVTWTSITAWTATIPVTNNAPITVAAYNKAHQPVGSTGTVSVTYSLAGPAPDPRNFIVFNEVMYNPAPNAPAAEYIELYNLHTNFAFNIGSWRINGVDYTFPAGAFFPPRSYIVLVKDRVAFGKAYGATVPIFDQYSGSLQGDGETLTLIKPGATTNDVDVVVDKLRYEGAAPWSTNANNSGSSLQLIDPNQDNSRVGNWASAFVPAVFTPAISTPAAPRDGWRFFSASGTITSISAAQRLVFYLGEAGSALIDDISVVNGTVPEVGQNFVRNGDFESPLVDNPTVTNSWSLGTNYTNSLIVGDLVHSGNGALKIVGTSPGAANSPFNRMIYQFLNPLPPTITNTLSFWYWATNSATNLFGRILNSSGITTGPGSTATNINIFFTPSNYVPPMLVSPATNSVSPGSNNVLSATLAPFPTLWINEVQAENVTGILDNNGQRDPWIEIYNTSTNTVSLAGLYLTHTYTNYTNWAFPGGSSIGPTQFLVVFCDGQAAQTTVSEYHTSFRLPAASGSVALSRLHNNAPQVMDYVNYAGLHSDRSYGSFPDGQPFDRQEFFYVTPRGTNNGSSAPLVVFINEWMAGNASALADPADTGFEDWFELYNPSSTPVDIAGYYLTDVLTNKFNYLITTNGPHIIPPQGYLLVWADNEPEQNNAGGVLSTDLHADFALSLGGEAIGLFAADGTQIDAVTFGQQTNNVSQGRFPDGNANIVYMPTTISPRAANYIPGAFNAAPVLAPIGNKVIYLGQTLAFTATATDSDVPAQALTFSLSGTPPSGASISGAGAFTWTPSGVSTSSITIRVADSGAPSMSDTETITVQVLGGPNFTSSQRNGTNLELTWGTLPGKKYAVDYKSNLNAAQWTPIQTNTAVGNSLSFTNTTISPAQGFFRIRLVD